MHADQPNQGGEGAEPSKPPQDPAAFTQEIQHAQVSARVPERVGRGVFCTGAMVLQGPHEFVIDFVLRMAQPHQIVARVILPPTILPSVIGAIRENLGIYTSKFGPPPTPPQQQPPTPPPPVEEIYSQLKLPDEQLSGAYANTVMIAHSHSEFYLDFITNFYPRSAVSCRIYMSAPQLPSFLGTLTRSFQQYQQKHGQNPPKNNN